MDLFDSLRTFFAAATPIGELRLAIPLGVYVLNMPWYQVLPLALIGNILPVLVLVPGLERIARLLESFPNPAGRMLRWRADKLRASQVSRFQRYESVALVLLVAIPLPLTGAWTGSLASWVFQIPARKAIPLISLGVLIAGLIVTLVTVLGLEIGDFLLSDRV